MRAAIPGHASISDFPFEPVEHGTNGSVAHDPFFDRMVFILIDALRADFILSYRNEDDLPKMALLQRRIADGEGRAFLAKAHPPTVTMPRIKVELNFQFWVCSPFGTQLVFCYLFSQALTSGSIPGFVDVVMNFDSSALADDNLVSQLHLAGKQIVFYGDDTWIRLFPGHFIRSDGTTSFFVTDFTEVIQRIRSYLSHL